MTATFPSFARMTDTNFDTSVVSVGYVGGETLGFTYALGGTRTHGLRIRNPGGNDKVTRQTAKNHPIGIRTGRQNAMFCHAMLHQNLHHPPTPRDTPRECHALSRPGASGPDGLVVAPSPALRGEQ